MRWICCLLVLACVSCGVQEPEQEAWKLKSEWMQRGPVKAQVQLLHDKMSILQQQDLRIIMEYPEGMDPHLPGYLERLEGFRPVPWRDDRKIVNSGNVVLEKFMRFELFESGEQVIPPFRIDFSTGFGADRATISLDTPDLSFNILSIDNPALVNAPLEDNDQLFRPKATSWWKVLGLACAGCAILALLIYGWKRFGPHKSMPIPVPELAHEWAWRALEALVNEQESGALSNEIFVDRLSLILRTYIEKRYGIHAPEQTTEEFLAQGVKQHAALAEQQLVLTRFMEYADLIKFAKQEAGSEDVQKGFDFVKDFVEQTQEVSA